MPLHRNVTVMLFVIAALAWSGQPSTAGYQTVTGQVRIIAAPPSVKPGDLQSNTVLNTFVEHTSLKLTSAVKVDDTASGTFTDKSSLVGGTIAAGTVVDSYFFHSDPVNPSQIYVGSATFTTQILGVIVLTDSLNATDAQLGAPGTIYSTTADRGLKLSSAQDSFTLSADLRTITFHLDTHGSIDEFRVLTAAVPEPSSALLLGLGTSSFLGVRRLRRARRQD